MALDYYYDAPEGRVSGALADADLALCVPAFTILEKKTGVFIDPYGDTRLYPDHARIVLAALPDANAEGILAFRRNLESAVQNRSVIHFLGD